MPEGDTIHRTATRLAPALAGKTVSSFRAQRLIERGPEPGERIDGVEARGKFLLVHFGDGTTLETHMKMSGSWHIYRRGERWRRSPRSARAVIETDDGWVAVCFSAPHVKLVRGQSNGLRRSGGSGRGQLGPDHLGPDLCTPDADLDEVVRRFELRDGSDPVVDLLLDQRIFCGVGNVYKSEVLFQRRLHPLTPVGSIDAAHGRNLAVTAQRLLLANLGSGPRVTTGGETSADLAVYGRRGLPCLRCDTAIRYARNGRHVRSTYWCPDCQPELGGEGD
jgi:endonuclease-8